MAARAKSVVAPSSAVRSEWLRRVEAEYRSAAITQHLGLWLIQIGAPPSLIADAGRIVDDEMTHAEKSHAVFVAAGGAGAPSLPRESLGLQRTSAPLEHDVLRAGVEVFCLGETVAVRLFKRLRAPWTKPVARRALDRILRDEVRHREFGWTLLEWLLSTPLAPELRGVLARELPAMIARLRRNYGADRVPESAVAFAASDSEWGLMPLDEYRDAVEETFTRDYVPRFAALDIDVTEH
ncbi:MAG TPA: ferritin-like domain-containing protein [Polyangiaceae bacterium]|jgi:hypothetical protein|nr:ferritin-like domain-containing protein [Polyangiaceae bacterium]